MNKELKYALDTMDEHSDDSDYMMGVINMLSFGGDDWSDEDQDFALEELSRQVFS